MLLSSQQKSAQRDLQTRIDATQSNGVFDPELAYLSLSAFHQALGNSDVECVLRMCASDVSYLSNISRGSHRVLTFKGLRAAERVLSRTISSFEYISVVDQISSSGNKVRANFSYMLRHRDRGFVLTGSCREIVEYRGAYISRIENYADSPRAAAYSKLVAWEQEPRAWLSAGQQEA